MQNSKTNSANSANHPDERPAVLEWPQHEFYHYAALMLKLVLRFWTPRYRANPRLLQSDRSTNL
jgi:hypothetical protein